jgi:hypothetical protein
MQGFLPRIAEASVAARLATHGGVLIYSAACF